MADITVDSITNADGTGIFDKLMETVNKNIETQYLNNRITGSDYANVYLSSMQAALSQSVQYILQEQLTEAQIDGIAADNLLKAKQLEIAQQELTLKEAELNRLRNATEAELEKQWGYAVTRDVDGALVLGSSTDAGKIDKELELLQVQKDGAYTDRVLKDKQAAKLGLDNVMKQAEAAKLADPSFKYTPNYEGQA